jgi:hypothetical protein
MFVYERSDSAIAADRNETTAPRIDGRLVDDFRAVGLGPGDPRSDTFPAESVD